jgi:uncharacterized protein involved in high-affinity Fe2+ transport
MTRNKLYILRNLVFSSALIACAADAAVFKIGDTEIRNGMSIQPLYIQSVMVEGANSPEMDHSSHNTGEMSSDMSHEHNHDHGGESHHSGHNMEGDIHLEAAVTATSENDWGFPSGAWVPYLQIHFSVTKTDNDYETGGVLIPMAANDGPHYGNNVKLDGPGKYTLQLHVSPPDGSVFMRHFDKETGVDSWWETFTIERQFTFIGVGKKGGY